MFTWSALQNLWRAHLHWQKKLRDETLKQEENRELVQVIARTESLPFLKYREFFYKIEIFSLNCFRWEAERILSFIPPDGNFRLMSYLIGSQNVVAIPLYLRHSLCFSAGNGGTSGKLDITVGPKQTMGRQLESVRLEVPMPKVVLNCTLNATQGKYTFDPVSKVLAWDVGKVDPAKLPNIKGTVSNIMIQ